MPTTPVERHQNQAIAQKLGILKEKVTSMTGLNIQKYLLRPIQNVIFTIYMRNFNKNRRYAPQAYFTTVVRSTGVLLQNWEVCRALNMHIRQ